MRRCWRKGLGGDLGDACRVCLFQRPKGRKSRRGGGRSVLGGSVNEVREYWGGERRGGGVEGRNWERTGSHCVIASM